MTSTNNRMPMRRVREFTIHNGHQVSPTRKIRMAALRPRRERRIINLRLTVWTVFFIRFFCNLVICYLPTNISCLKSLFVRVGDVLNSAANRLSYLRWAGVGKPSNWKNAEA